MPLRRHLGSWALLSLLLAACAGEPASPEAAPALEERPGRSFRVRYALELPPLEAGDQVRLWVPVPGDDAHQTIGALQVDSPWVHRIEEESLHGNRMLYLEGEAPEDVLEVNIEYDVTRRINAPDLLGFAVAETNTDSLSEEGAEGEVEIVLEAVEADSAAGEAAEGEVEIVLEPVEADSAAGEAAEGEVEIVLEPVEADSAAGEGAEGEMEIVIEVEVEEGEGDSAEDEAAAAEAAAAEAAAAEAAAAEAAPYLEPSALCVVTEEMQEIARGLEQEASSPQDKARRIYDFILRSMSYDKSGQGWGRGDSDYACREGRGNCTDYHSYFVALCRALAIPARFQIGLMGPYEPGQSTFTPIGSYHCWAEFHLPGWGWIPVDISEADRRDQPEGFFGLQPANRVTLSTGRDLILEPAQDGMPLNYFVAPYAEVNGYPVSSTYRVSWAELP